MKALSTQPISLRHLRHAVAELVQDTFAGIDHFPVIGTAPEQSMQAYSTLRTNS
jgi:hypothetical protein